MSPQSQHPVAYQAHDDFGPDQQRETVSDDAIGYPAGSSAPRQSFNQSELMALAKRLEASIPATGVPKAEKATPAPVPAPVPAPAQIQMPPVSLSAPIAPPAPAAEPAPQPVSVSLKPQPAPQGNYAPEMNMVPVASPPQLRPSAPRPTMAPPIRPSVQPPVAAPVMPQEQSAIAENYSEPHPIPMPEPVPVPPPVQTREAAPAPDAPKDRQAAALDENLRRLLGRKIEPRQ